MIVTQKAIPRRTILRGLGTTLALPLLDAMVPALARAQSAAAKPPNRLSTVYLPNGIMMDKWTPATEGAGFKLMPIMEPLAPFKDRMLVLTGLAHNSGRAQAGENTGDHARAGATYLSGVHPKKTEGADTRPAFPWTRSPPRSSARTRSSLRSNSASIRRSCWASAKPAIPAPT